LFWAFPHAGGAAAGDKGGEAGAAAAGDDDELAPPAFEEDDDDDDVMQEDDYYQGKQGIIRHVGLCQSLNGGEMRIPQAVMGFAVSVWCPTLVALQVIVSCPSSVQAVAAAADAACTLGPSIISRTGLPVLFWLVLA
jgi:hypothetical protein